MIRLNDRTIIFLLILLQLAVCLPFISAFPIGLDEPFSIYWAQQDLDVMIPELNKGNNSPLHFVLLHFWQKLFGISAVSVRSLSLIFSLLTIPVLYKLSKKFMNAEFAMVAVLLFICSRFYHFHSLEARMYALLTLETVTLAYLLSELFFDRKLRIFPVVIMHVFLLYTHYLGVVFIACEIFLILIFIRKLDKKLLLKFIMAMALTGVLFIPGALIFVIRLSGGNGSGWVPEAQFSELYGNIVRFLNTTPITICMVIVMLISFFIKPGNKINQLKHILQNNQTIFLLLLFALPYLGMFAYSKLISPIFIDRYILFIMPFLYVLVAKFAYEFSSEKAKTIVVTVIPILMALGTHWIPENDREPDKMADLVRAWETEKTRIIVAPPYYDLTFNYHYDRTKFETGVSSGQTPVQAVYNFSEISDSSSEQIILVDDNVNSFYPQNGLYEGLANWGNQSKQQTFKGGSRVTLFIKK